LKSGQNSTGAKWYYCPGCTAGTRAFSRWPCGVGADG